MVAECEWTLEQSDEMTDCVTYNIDEAVERISSDRAAAVETAIAEHLVNVHPKLVVEAVRAYV